MCRTVILLAVGRCHPAARMSVGRFEHGDGSPDLGLLVSWHPTMAAWWFGREPLNGGEVALIPSDFGGGLWSRVRAGMRMFVLARDPFTRHRMVLVAAPSAASPSLPVEEAVAFVDEHGPRVEDGFVVAMARRGWTAAVCAAEAVQACRVEVPEAVLRGLERVRVARGAVPGAAPILGAEDHWSRFGQRTSGGALITAASAGALERLWRRENGSAAMRGTGSPVADAPWLPVAVTSALAEDELRETRTFGLDLLSSTKRHNLLQNRVGKRLAEQGWRPLRDPAARTKCDLVLVRDGTLLVAEIKALGDRPADQADQLRLAIGQALHDRGLLMAAYPHAVQTVALVVADRRPAAPYVPVANDVLTVFDGEGQVEVDAIATWLDAHPGR